MSRDPLNSKSPRSLCYVALNSSSDKWNLTGLTVRLYGFVGFGLPDVGERSGALKVNLDFRLVAGGLASVRVGGHAVETDLVAPEGEAKAEG